MARHGRAAIRAQNSIPSALARPASAAASAAAKSTGTIAASGAKRRPGKRHGRPENLCRDRLAGRETLAQQSLPPDAGLALAEPGQERSLLGHMHGQAEGLEA